MQKSNFKISPLRIAGIVALVVAFACIRFFEGHLFYDPFIVFFKQTAKKLPEYDAFRLFLSLMVRYLLNTLVSLGILWLTFKDRQVVKLSTLLYAVFFVAIAAALFIVLGTKEPDSLLVFYLRRFLKEPLLLLLFLPAFYYQKHVK